MLIRVCGSGSVIWGTHLLKRTFILDAFGSNKHPAVSEGQILHCRAPELLEQPPSLIVHPVTRGEMKVNDGYIRTKEITGACNKIVHQFKISTGFSISYRFSQMSWIFCKLLIVEPTLQKW